MILAVLALTSATVQIETSVVQKKLHERLLVKHEARWVEIATSNGLTQGPLTITGPGGELLSAEVQKVEKDG